MDLESLKNQLEADGKSELAETVVQLIEAEKQRGIKEVNKRNSENQNLRKFKQAIDALGYDGESDLDGFTSSLVDLRSQANDKGSNSLTLKSLNGQIAKLTTALNNEQQLRRRAENSSKHEKINAELTSRLSDKVYGADLLVKSLISENKVDLIDNKIVFKDGDIALSMDDGIKTLLDERKDIVRNSQPSGGGSHGGGKPVNSNIKAIMNSGDKALIRQNIDAIRSELGLGK